MAVKNGSLHHVSFPSTTGARVLLFVAALLLSLSAFPAGADYSFGDHFFRAKDPGVRGGDAGAGQAINGLTAAEQVFFDNGLDAFAEVNDVRGTITGDLGLGPRFNLDSCAGCHAQPAVGGTSPRLNPQVAVATNEGADNIVPFFIDINGPVREARFKFNPDGTRDGSVHDLFVITGRGDAVGCNIRQPDFAAAAQANNLIFRIPTPVFGAGLIENIPDKAILANMNSDLTRKHAMNVRGHVNRAASGAPNRSGNDATITRFGWKAQVKSPLIFSGEAYNVEQGVSNEMFPQERDETAACLFNATPEDFTNFAAALPIDFPSDIERFAFFMRFLAPPTPARATLATIRGRALFEQVGCTLCHTPTLKTGTTTVAALSNQNVNLFSDLLLHNMGTGLADDIIQGNAGPDEFRSAPLWGIGQRIFFLHDGRTSDLIEAIQAHSSPGSEANKVVANFNALLERQKQDILDFLRSL